MRRPFTIGFDIPIRGATWSSDEYGELLRGLLTFGWRTHDDPVWLREYLAHVFGGRTTLYNSGRSALEVALRNVQAASPRQASVLVPSFVCRAVPGKVQLCGLTPVFYDIQPDLIPCERSLRNTVRQDTVAVVYPYLYGKVGGIESAAAFCKARGLHLIEDCAAAFLVEDETGRMSGTTGDQVVFSFQQGKTVVAGSGGALIDRMDERFNSIAQPRRNWSSLEEFRLSLAKVSFVTRKFGNSAGYAIEEFMRGRGDNFATRTQEQVRPLSALDARLIRRQIPYWRARQERKLAILSRYARNLAACQSLAMPQYREGQFVGRLFIRYPEPVLRRLDDQRYESEVVTYLRKRGIQTQLAYYPAHRLPEFVDSPKGSLPCTESLYQSLIEVPSQIDLWDDEVDRVSEVLIESAALLRN